MYLRGDVPVYSASGNNARRPRVSEGHPPAFLWYVADASGIRKPKTQTRYAKRRA